MKTLLLLLTALVLTTSTHLYAGGSRQWTLLSKQEGVEFYISTDNAGSKDVKTFLKVKNTNGYKTLVSFSAIFPCTNTEKKTQYEKIFVSPDGMAIYTYQVCQTSNMKDFELSSINVAHQ